MKKESVKCPVCHMQVDKDSFALEYMGCAYAFCSQQCHDRFRANPHLYVGMPGHAAPKHEGVEILKKRTLKLQETLSSDQAKIVVSALENMMGIKRISVQENCVFIIYDLLQATAEQIENAIVNCGENLGDDLVVKLKRAFIHYFEETELDNLEQPGHGLHH